VTLLLALLLAAASPASAEGQRGLLDSFKAACSRTGDLDAMKADSTAAGWEPIAEHADPRIERLNRIGREAVEKEGLVSGASFRRRDGGRELFLIVSRYEDKSGFWSVGCRAYDFSATAPLDGPGLDAWMGKPATGAETPAPGIYRQLWEPGWRDGISVEAWHVPAGHPLGESFGLSGNVLVAQAIGGF
jgi:hypothetical protein